MSWEIALLVIFGALLILMSAGMPVAFAFMTVNVIGAFVVFGGTKGLDQLILQMFTSVCDFTLIAIPLFVLMGELMFRSGVAAMVIGVIDKWLGRLPGRLSLLAVVAGTLFATLTGSSAASTALMGSVLIPDMDKRGYKREMSIGPILGSGLLAIMIPPSSLAVLVGAVGEIPVGKILIAIIPAGLLIALSFAVYIVIRCSLKPSLAPSYEVEPSSLSAKLKDFARYVLPLGLVIFLVMGVIFLGIAGPTEAAATGTLGVILVLLYYKKFNWNTIVSAFKDTLRITGMMFLIIAGAVAFSQILAFTGAGNALSEIAVGLSVPPILVVIIMMVLLLILGCFMSVIGIIMITLPIFVPVILALNYDPVWFAVIFLINMEIAMITPPYGMNLFIMKGVVPDVSMRKIIIYSIPFLGCNLAVMALIIFIPSTVMWLPHLMH